MHLTHKAALASALLGSFGLSTIAYAQEPVSWYKADGNASDSVSGNDGTLSGGVGYDPGAVGQGFVFDGTNGVVHIPDAANLAITGSLSITADVFLQQVSPNGGQIFFRGDDRGGLDPYFLAVDPGGNLVFQVGDASGQSSEIQAIMPLQQFVFVDASLNDATGQMLLRINNQVVAQTTTTIRPFKDLDPSFNPGVGIGNTQDPSAYDEPFNGIIDEVKVYNTVVPAPVPEASSVVSLGLLLVLGVGGLAVSRRRSTQPAA